MSSASIRKYTISPKTHNKILVGGSAYLKLAKDPKYANRLRPRPTKAERFFPKKRSPSGSKSRGCSNQGKYPNVPKNLFCGPAGGACEGTFPVNTRKRAIAARAYSGNAPNPKGIRDCVDRIAKQKGWMKNGVIKRVSIKGVPHKLVKDKNGKPVLFRA